MTSSICSAQWAESLMAATDVHTDDPAVKTAALRNPFQGSESGRAPFSFLHVVVCPCQQQPVSMDTFCLFCIKGIFEVKILTLTLMWHVGAELPATNLVFSQNSLSDDYAHHLARAFPEC